MECRRKHSKNSFVSISLQVIVSNHLGICLFCYVLFVLTRPKPSNPIIKEHCFIIKYGFESDFRPHHQVKQKRFGYLISF